MTCSRCSNLIPDRDRYCAYCGQAQVHPVVAVCERLAELVSSESFEQVRTADALISAYTMRLRAKGLIEGYPAVDVRPLSVAEATGVLYETAKDVVRKGYDPALVSSLAGVLAEGMFYDQLKRVMRTRVDVTHCAQGEE